MAIYGRPGGPTARGLWLAFCAKCGKELPMSATFCPSCGTPVSGATPAAEPISGVDAVIKESKAQEYWIRRLVALIIDGIIIGVVVTVIFVFAASSAFLFGGGFGVFGAIFGAFAVVVGILLIFYFPLMESTSGATIGKKALGLRVVSKTGGNPTFVEAFIRNVSKIYWILLLLDVIVGLATSKGYQQKYSDRLAGTSVVPA
jgi:uncharacterized RDD family membrane protein YckC